MGRIMMLLSLIPLTGAAQSAEIPPVYRLSESSLTWTENADVKDWWWATQTAARQVFVDGTEYEVRYEYRLAQAWIPLTMPPGQPHYAAEITVLRVKQHSKRRRETLIVAKFPGQYTERGCFEDEPEMLVRKALELVKKETK